MAFFTGDAQHDQKVIFDSTTTLMKHFSGWIQVAHEWMAMIDQQRGRSVARQAGVWSAQQRSNIQSKRDALSEFISNEVSSMHKNYISRSQKVPPFVDVMIMATEANQAAKQSIMERAIIGIIAEQDDKTHTYSLGTSWLRRLISYTSCPGKVVQKVHMRETFPGSGKATVDWDLWNPLNTFHDFDSWPRRVFRRYVTHKDSAIADLMRLGLPIPSGVANLTAASVIVTEFWVEERLPEGKFSVQWAMTINNILAGGTQETGFDHLPINITCINADPSMGQEVNAANPAIGAGTSDRGVSSHNLLHHAQPFFADVLHTFNQFEQFHSLNMEALAWAVNPDTRFMSEDGSVVLPSDQHGPGSRVGLATESTRGKLTGIERPVYHIPGIEGTPLGEAFRRVFDRAYNPALYGEAQFAGESGFRGVLAADAAETNIHDPSVGQGISLTWGAREALHQFKHNVLGLKLSVEGRTSRGLDAGHIFLGDFSPSDFPEKMAFSVITHPNIPRDIMQMIIAFDRSVQAGLYDPATARSVIAAVQDPQAMQDRVELWKASQSPENQASNTIAFFFDKWQKLEEEAKRLTNPENKRAKLQEALAARNAYRRAASQATGQNITGTAAAGVPTNVLPPQLDDNPQIRQAAGGPLNSTNVRPNREPITQRP